MENKNKHLNHIIKGGLILTASSFIAKLLSAVYKVPFQNLTGDAGFYVYQQIYPIYGLAVGLTLTGLPAFISKVVSEAEDETMLQTSMQELNTWLWTIGLGMFALLQFGATTMAQLMGDVQLVPVIQSVSYFFLFLPFLALTRGYFQGDANMVPTSISQVIEQLVRVLVLLGVAIYFTSSSWSVYEMGQNAYTSSWLSAIASSVVLLYYLWKRQKGHQFLKVLKPRWSLKMGRRLFSEGVLLIATSSLMVLFQFIDSFTVFNALSEVRYAPSLAMNLKGVYDRGQPFVQLGLVVGLGFATSSLPILRKWALENKKIEWVKNASSLLRMTLLLAGAATVGLMAVMPAMNYTLFTDHAGTSTLQIFVISVLLASFIYSMHTILQSKQGKDNSILALLIGLVFKATMNKLAVRTLGISGASLVTVFSLLIICGLMMQMIEKEVWRATFRHHFLFKTAALLFAMYFSVWGTAQLATNLFDLSGRTANLMLTLLGVFVGLLVFGAGAIWLNIFHQDELEQLPIPSRLKQRKRK